MSSETTKQDLSVSMLKANIYGLLLTLPPLLIVSAAFVAVWGDTQTAFISDNPWVNFAIFMAVLIVGTLIHELLHGVTWKVMGNVPWSQIEIGFQWKTFTPYAHAKVPLGVRAYRWGTAMPGLVLGLVPAVLAVVTGSGSWYLFSLIFILAAGGDALILWLIRKVPSDYLIEDHPTLAGCFALPPNEEA